MYERILTKHIDKPGIDTLEIYRQSGGYEALVRALQELSPQEIVEMVKLSGLGGRGGAGFPTGVKWGLLAQNGPHYLCCNADEGEPGTFKDRMLMERLPHQLLEGMIITAYACQVNMAFIYIRGEFAFASRQLQRAIDEAQAAGLLGENILGSGYSLEIIVHRGAGAYICGEETALLESLEGRRGYPRLRPPFPATSGLYGSPTVINNCETLSTIPLIINHGAQWYTSFGTARSKGTRLFSLSGHIKKPGNYELPIGAPLRTLIYDEAYGGGILDDRNLKAVMPGGSSTPMLGPEHLDVTLDAESLGAAGSVPGSGGVIVLHDGVCIVAAVQRMSEFYRDESCGKCTPCREGTYWIASIMERLEHGQGKEGDIDLLLDICSNIGGRSFCPHGDFAIG
ncbi:MAG TPA: NADH-quinone oxidoreductase subunit NuoF, partial [Ktedonobacteraceae bacterium]|nr:NADH-quinone oxidoreductase subunit NuoF [Ktedonobacteraceae bacterium]